MGEEEERGSGVVECSSRVDKGQTVADAVAQHKSRTRRSIDSVRFSSNSLCTYWLPSRWRFDSLNRRFTVQAGIILAQTIIVFHAHHNRSVFLRGDKRKPTSMVLDVRPGVE
jgi:hypothetical protein